MTGKLTFDAAEHAYRLDGKHLPSVTQIIRAVIPFPYKCDSWYLQRGTIVHRSVAMMLRGSFDYQESYETWKKENGESVAMGIINRVHAAERFYTDFSEKLGGAVKSLEIEGSASSPLGFAGTPDLFANGLLIDWKSSDEPETEIQLGGYACMKPRGEVRECLAVELREDGTYSVETYKPSRASGLFLNVFSVYQWMVKNGRLPKREG